MLPVYPRALQSKVQCVIVKAPIIYKLLGVKAKRQNIDIIIMTTVKGASAVVYYSNNSAMSGDKWMMK